MNDIDILTVAHTKGGVGKSTLVWQIATYLKEKSNLKICIVDLDFQETQIHLNNLRNSLQLSPMDVKSFDTQESFLDFLDSNDYDLIIIDVGGFDSDMTRLAVAVTSYLLLPLNMYESTELIGANKFKTIIDDISASIDRKIGINILANMLPYQIKNVNKDEIREYFDDVNILDARISRRADFSRTLSNTKGVVSLPIDNKARMELEGLIKEIFGVDFGKK
jgi:chromosome partitioning protein